MGEGIHNSLLNYALAPSPLRLSLLSSIHFTGLSANTQTSKMFSTTYDEKAAYEQRYHSHSHPLRANPNSYSHSHSRNTSSTSTTSTSSSSSSNRYDSEAPPPYTYLFYNSIGVCLVD